MQADSFEKQKNVKAFAYTGVVCAGLVILFMLVSWSQPQLPEPPLDQGIEVNLGNSDQGWGDVAPAIPGEPTAGEETSFDPPPAARTSAPEDNSPLADDNNVDAVPVSSPVKPSTKPKPTHTETSVNRNNNTSPVVNPTPAPPKPKAVYAGGSNTGSGGNNADSYNGVRNQGIAGGNGDQGKINGNPNSDSYTGNGGSGRSGVSIRSGLSGRHIARMPSFEDDFNENAKVAVDIDVADNGSVLKAVVNPRGTTTTNSNIKNIALRKAKQLKFNNGTASLQSGTIVFDFRLKS